MTQKWTVDANKNGSGRSRCRLRFSRYAFLHLATPTKPVRSEPNNHTATGTGTTEALKEVASCVSGHPESR